MTRLRFLAPAGMLACTLALGACQFAPRSAQARADAQTREACRARVDQVFDEQHRGEIYSPPPTVNTPYSGNYLPGSTERGLSDQFEHDKMVDDCIRNTGTGTGPARTPPPPPPPPSR